MVTLSVCSTKGGTGKSTLAVTLATYLASTGCWKVCLMDLDAGQGSASAWARARGTNNSGPELVPIKSLRADLRRLATRGVDYVFVDSPPTLDDSGVVEAAVEVADYILSPCRPSILDIGAAETIANLAGDTPIGFLLMDVTDGKGWKGINASAAKALADVGHVFNQHLTHRPSYVNNLAVGKTGPETDKVAAQEVTALWGEIAKWMK
jgi:cellulose biosynthesis protein BcsQ